MTPPTLGALRVIALIDVGLIVGALGALGWAFGWRAATLGAVFLGTQAPAGLAWTGGAFLRFDWLFLVVLAVALLRKGRAFGAGFALGWAGLLRVFPLLLTALAGVRRDSELFVDRQERDASPQRDSPLPSTASTAEEARR